MNAKGAKGRKKSKLLSPQQPEAIFSVCCRLNDRERSKKRKKGAKRGEYRAATVRNQDAWYTAFDVKPENHRYLKPEQRVKVW